MKRKCLAVGIILLFVGTCIIPAIAQDIEKSSSPTSRGNWLYVGGSGPGNYTRIQDAINASSDGDTVFVYNGTYYENVVVDKSINLIGEDKNITIIDGNGSRDVILLTRFSEGVTINGFTIQNSGTPGFLGGISIQNAGYNIIYGNIITKNWNGIIIYYSDGNIISENVITDNDDGIQIIRSSSNNITGNVIKKNVGDIEIDDSHLNKVVKNLITGQVLIYGLCNNNIISKNNLEGTVSFQLEPGGINIWYNNYWKKPRFLPKPIFGVWMLGEDLQIWIPWFQFDWNPAKEPYDIGGLR